MTEAERIRKEATKFATFETAPNEMEKYNELYSGYITGATAENERLQQELKEAVIGQEQLALDLVRALDLNKSLEDQIEYQNKSAKEDHDKISKLEFELKSAQELNRELVERVGDLIGRESFKLKYPRTAEEFESLINKAK